MNSEKHVMVRVSFGEPVAVCSSMWNVPQGRLVRECSRSTLARTQRELKRWAQRNGMSKHASVLEALTQLPAS